jgi:hypothetical protein
MKVLLLTVLAFFGTQIHASELQELDQFLQNAAMDSNGQLDVDCTNVAAALRDWQADNNAAMLEQTNYNYNVATTVSGWYRELSRYEGQTTTIRYGAFDPIRRSGYTAHDNDRYFVRLYQSLDARLYDITQTLMTCL